MQQVPVVIESAPGVAGYLCYSPAFPDVPSEYGRTMNQAVDHYEEMWEARFGEFIECEVTE